MKSFALVDFLKHEGLNELRRRMAAPLVDYRPDGVTEKRITHRDLERLATTGITVGPEEIEIQRDGTFTYQDVPVLLYIFAPTHFGDREMRMPKFHLCNCRTWSDMKARGRQDRYVASTRMDGLFELEAIMPNNKTKRTTERLDVCQNCLADLSWKGFRSDARRAERKHLVQSFSLKEFFDGKRRSPIREKPRYTPETVPSANYTDDFDAISSNLRAAAQWRCQGQCGRLFAALWQRKFLHVHHLNGVRGDNRPENLRVYCLGCHAAQPGHEHMRRTPAYLEFRRLFADIGPGASGGRASTM